MSNFKPTFGLLATVVIAGTLCLGFSAGVLVAKPTPGAVAAETQPQASDGTAENLAFSEDLARGDVETLVSYYSDWDELCRGYGMGSALTCEKREVVAQALGTKGMCNGKVGQAGYQQSWRPCGPNSCQPGQPC